MLWALDIIFIGYGDLAASIISNQFPGIFFSLLAERAKLFPLG